VAGHHAGIDAPPPPPAIVQPAPYEASYGLVAGRLPARTALVVVRVDGRRVAEERVSGRSFSIRIALPRRDVRVSVTAVGARGRSTATVGPVFGLPRSAEPRIAPPSFEDRGLTRHVRSLARGYPGTCGVYVENLTTGAGAAWNAGASFPAASTLKLAIAVAVLRRHDGIPRPDSRVGSLLRAMLTWSDNGAANALEAWLGGSTSGGSAVVNETMRGLGLAHSEMYGGYGSSRTTSGRVPVRVDSQPAWGYGKRTTAADLARLARVVWLASAAKGPLARAYPGFTRSDARHLLYLLAHVADRGKLDRYLPPSDRALHKAGWLADARHDSGLVFWPGGVFVASVLTYSPSGAGRASDELAGRVAKAARDRFAG
jgi:beta-lactamase class A